MTLEEMIAKIQAGQQDPSFTVKDDVLPLINEALEEAAKKYCHADLMADHTITVVAGASNPVELPDDYSHDLYRVVNTTFNRPITIRTNPDVLAKLFDGLNSPGAIVDVAEDGRSLYFRPSPTTETEQVLAVHYYKAIEEYEEGDEEETPEWLPKRFHQGIIVDYALKELWALVEDGIDGQKINTAFYEARYERALGKLAKHTKKNPRQRPVIKRTARFF